MDLVGMDPLQQGTRVEGPCDDPHRQENSIIHMGRYSGHGPTHRQELFEHQVKQPCYGERLRKRPEKAEQSGAVSDSQISLDQLLEKGAGGSNFHNEKRGRQKPAAPFIVTLHPSIYGRNHWMRITASRDPHHRTERHPSQPACGSHRSTAPLCCNVRADDPCQPVKQCRHSVRRCHRSPSD